MEEHVILVDAHDNQVGTMEKMQAHLGGILHRAISVFICNTKGDLLLQQRAAGKYHSAGLWSNACCSHPRPGETSLDAANRRLFEEMGLTCALREAFSFTYCASLDHGLIEHEYDHVFTGATDALPHADSSEVSAWRYISQEALEIELEQHPETFTEWFRICVQHKRSLLFTT